MPSNPPSARMTEPQIDCPLCGDAVKQVASATLDLALSQHVRWVCRANVAASQPTEQAQHEATARELVDRIRHQHNEAGPDEPRDMAYDLTVGEATAAILSALTAATAQQAEEIARLRKALKDYGQHEDTCDFKYRPVGTVFDESLYPCTCGLTSALSEGTRTMTKDEQLIAALRQAVIDYETQSYRPTAHYIRLFRDAAKALAARATPPQEAVRDIVSDRKDW